MTALPCVHISTSKVIPDVAIRFFSTCFIEIKQRYLSITKRFCDRAFCANPTQDTLKSLAIGESKEHGLCAAGGG